MELASTPVGEHEPVDGSKVTGVTKGEHGPGCGRGDSDAAYAEAFPLEVSKSGERQRSDLVSASSCRLRKPRQDVRASCILIAVVLSVTPSGTAPRSMTLTICCNLAAVVVATAPVPNGVYPTFVEPVAEPRLVSWAPTVVPGCSLLLHMVQ